MNDGGKHMEGKQTRISDAVLIEIVHGIKDIIVELINHAFPGKQLHVQPVKPGFGQVLQGHVRHLPADGGEKD